MSRLFRFMLGLSLFLGWVVLGHAEGPNEKAPGATPLDLSLRVPDMPSAKMELKWEVTPSFRTCE